MSDLSDFTARTLNPQGLAELRRRAASRLSGAAATKGSTARVGDALSVLHALASSPETAADALTLLHELQVLQVEVDLQAQELCESRADLESALRRQIEIYDHQPAGCYTVDARMVLAELNLVGAGMLGITRAQALGLPLDSFFSVDSQPRLRSALAGLVAGLPSPACRLDLCPRRGAAQPVVAQVGLDASAGHYIVNLVRWRADDE